MAAERGLLDLVHAWPFVKMNSTVALSPGRFHEISRGHKILLILVNQVPF
jgi:hypothetical protein